MAANRARWDRWRIETARAYRGRVARTLGISIIIHGAIVGCVVAAAPHIKLNFRRPQPPEYIEVALLDKPLPAPSVADAPPPDDEGIPIEVEGKMPTEPEAEAAPDVAYAPDASASAAVTPPPASDTHESIEAPEPEEGAAVLPRDANAPLMADAVAQRPEIETYVVPEYPPIARARKIQGSVVLVVIVDAMGNIEDNVKVMKSVPMLDQAALAAIHQWRFTPGRDADGNPVRVQMTVPIRFTLR